MTQDHIDNPSKSKIEFSAYHHPALKSGTYKVTVRQTIGQQTNGQQTILPASSFETSQRFTVAGERFTLKPTDIYAVFPPADSLGDHSTVLPHVAFTRSTLPWEQAAVRGNDGTVSDEADDSTPWLALLLFHEDESLGGTITKQHFLDAFGDAETGAASWSHLLQDAVRWLRPLPEQMEETAMIVAKSSRAAQTLDPAFAGAAGQIEAILDRRRSPQVVALKDLKKGVNGPLHWPDLPYEPLLHDENDQVTVIDVEQQLLADLLPTAPELHLLTHVRRGGDAGERAAGDELAMTIGNRLPRAKGVSIAHLVSVEGRYKQDGSFDFGEVQKDDQIRLISLKSWRFACVDPTGDFAGLLQTLDHVPGTLRLPGDEPVLEPYLAPGYVPAPHLREDGTRPAGWYRGPLITHPTGATPALPAQAAADLIRTDKALGMQDVSYAAAWELGRLLTLQSKQISVSLYNWKRAHAQFLRQTEARLLHPRWTAQGEAAGNGLPDQIAAWFDDLRLLRGVPFNYLVPDERMLPPESIRFFQVDHAWIDCLLDGAFSVGRLTGRLKETDQEQKLVLDGHLDTERMSGFLIRSSVVTGWPGLLVDGIGADQQILRLLRFERLSPSVLLCLFAGELSSAAVHQRPEALHFGLRAERGNESGEPVTIRWRQQERGILDIAALAAQIGANAAAFAVGMIEGVQRVSFNSKVSSM